VTHKLVEKVRVKLLDIQVGIVSARGFVWSHLMYSYPENFILF
jgi:hypothetical protein